MIRSVLLTAAIEDTEAVRSELEHQKITLLHYPLEYYQKLDSDSVREAFEKIKDFDNIAYGSKRNARFFVEKMKEFDKLDEVRERLNLALNQPTADFLENEGVPAVHPQSEGKAINLMEFMLRTRRIGNTLYPCGDKTKEELPGFLQELDIPVQELVLFTLEGPKKQDLMKFQEDVAAHEPAVIIFHSRRSVNRTLTAFPNLDYDDAHIITGDRAVTDRLEEKQVSVTSQADGSWESILKKVKEGLQL